MIPLDQQDHYRERYRTLKPTYRTSGQIYERLVAKHITPETKVLDAGCGRAGVIGLFRDKAGLTVGLDADLASLCDNVGLHQAVLGRLAALPFATASFDLVISSWVIEHLPEPERAFAEIARVLRPGGRFIFLTPNAWNYVVLVNRLMPAWLQFRLVPRLYGRREKDTFPVVYRANTRRKLHSLLGQAGLRCEEFYHVGDPSYVAANDLLFRLGVLLERLTDCSVLRSLKVHLVGSYVKE
ncbi:MAG: class I SAM-dependent methyltransferase [Chloroflexi bacterium]|nr:class I SAM-dependent methyltransferase [Chloroflexota bacterium]